MFEEHGIISKFKKDVAEHIDIIEDEINKGNREEVVLWLNELLSMRNAWQREFDKPGFNIKLYPWTTPNILNTNSTKRLARERIDILDEAIARIKQMFQAKGWEKAA
ncbi:hypothetical protein HYS31_08615 [Candidatus Woesearchaeota archaeon]|nr:hypothetical protein [Candidatus Woesearchaeota archaeon]